MKLILLERQIQAYYLCGGLLGFAVCLLLVSVSFAENADTSIVFRSSRTGISQIYQITFTSNRNENVDIYVMNADGTNPINLTQHREWDANPSWGLVPSLSVSPNDKLTILWGKVKRAQ